MLFRATIYDALHYNTPVEWHGAVKAGPFTRGALLLCGSAKQAIQRLQDSADLGACEAVIDGLAIAARFQQALGAHFGEMLA